MSTYYRYAERDVENQINWAEIGKNVTDMISTEVELREKKKAEIDRATNEYAKVLADEPLGQNQAYNRFMVNFTDNASSARLMQDRLLKSGQLKLKDYNLMRQNLGQGTDQFFSIAKEYNAGYEEKIRRMEEGESAQLEQFIMEQAESFANFADHELYINPTDFGVSLGKKVEKDGMMVLSNDPNDFIQMGELRMMVNQEVDKFDVNTAVKDIVDNLATKYVKTYGPLKSVDDIRQMGQDTKDDFTDDFETIKENYLKSILENSYHASSILTDAIGIASNGESYRFTRNPAEVNENTILVQEGEGGRFVTELNDEQRKEAMDYLDGVFESMIGREEKHTLYEQPKWKHDLKNEKDQEVKHVNYAAYLFGGTKAQKKAAVNYFAGLPDSNILRIDTSGDDAVKVYLQNGDTVTLDASSGKADFVKSITQLTGEFNTEKAIKRAGPMYNEIGNKYKKGPDVTYRKEAESKIKVANRNFASYLASDFEGVTKIESEKSLVSDISGIIGGYGFKVTETDGGNDVLQIQKVEQGKDGTDIITHETTISFEGAAENTSLFDKNFKLIQQFVNASLNPKEKSGFNANRGAP